MNKKEVMKRKRDRSKKEARLKKRFDKAKARTSEKVCDFLACF